MSLKHLVADRLDEDPMFRERANKDDGIVSLLINRYGLHYAIHRGEITKGRIVALVQDYASMDRLWRKILEENPLLRGTDYDDKDQLEAKVMVSLGYPAPQAIGPAEIDIREHQTSLL